MVIFRNQFREITVSPVRNIVIDCSLEILQEVLRQAQQLGLMNKNYNYFIANLDFHTIEMEPFQYSNTNITGVSSFIFLTPCKQFNIHSHQIPHSNNCWWLSLDQTDQGELEGNLRLHRSDLQLRRIGRRFPWGLFPHNKFCFDSRRHVYAERCPQQSWRRCWSH